MRLVVNLHDDGAVEEELENEEVELAATAVSGNSSGSPPQDRANRIISEVRRMVRSLREPGFRIHPIASDADTNFCTMVLANDVCLSRGTSVYERSTLFRDQYVCRLAINPKFCSLSSQGMYCCCRCVYAGDVDSIINAVRQQSRRQSSQANFEDSNGFAEYLKVWPLEEETNV